MQIRFVSFSSDELSGSLCDAFWVFFYSITGLPSLPPFFANVGGAAVAANVAPITNAAVKTATIARVFVLFNSSSFSRILYIFELMKLLLYNYLFI